MEIRRYVSGFLASNMYLIVDAGHAIVIDPFEDTAPAAGLTVDRILLTHEHYDHISGVNVWKKEIGAPVFCSVPCADNIRAPKKNLAAYFREFCELQTWIRLDAVPPYDPTYACETDETFDGEVSFAWQGHCWRLFELPGHSAGSCGILLDEKHLFSGDSLLENCETALRLPGGSPKKWAAVSLPRLKALPRGIRVYPGHFGDFDLLF